MLELVLKENEQWDEENEVFVHTKSQTLMLEHSLVSISKWEAKWKKPFLEQHNKEMPMEELIDYIKCMTITQNVDQDVYRNLSKKDINKVLNYINDSMTATWFREDDKKGRRSGQAITSELIYFWMISFQIPFECQKWHLNRLLTLIRICNENREDGSGQKKMSQRDLMNRNRALNEARKRRFNTHG